MKTVLNKKTGIITALLLLSLWQPAAAQQAAYKIGFVNTARVLKEAPQARKVEERLKAEFEPREAQLREQRQEILTLEEKLKTDFVFNHPIVFHQIINRQVFHHGFP